jgi:hypothetical protein
VRVCVCVKGGFEGQAQSIRNTAPLKASLALPPLCCAIGHASRLPPRAVPAPPARVCLGRTACPCAYCAAHAAPQATAPPRRPGLQGSVHGRGCVGGCGACTQMRATAAAHPAGRRAVTGAAPGRTLPVVVLCFTLAELCAATQKRQAVRLLAWLPPPLGPPPPPAQPAPSPPAPSADTRCR